MSSIIGDKNKSVTSKNPQLQEAETGQSVLVRDNKIHAVGSYQLLKKISSNPQLIDLQGNVLLPAFTDAHTHFVETAKQMLTLNVLGCQNDDEFYQRLIEYREKINKRINKGEQIKPSWIKGFGWEKRVLDKYPNINKNLIDKVFPDIPVSIASRDLHSNLCNSKALDVINSANSEYNKKSSVINQAISNQNLKNIDNIEGVVLGKFANGELNGFLYENSWTLLDRYIPPIDDDLLKKLLKELIVKSYKYGLCGVHSMEDRKSAEIVKNVCEEMKFYFTWYYLQMANDKSKDENIISSEIKPISNVEQPFKHKNYHFLEETQYFRNGGIKLFTDGSLGSDTAWMFGKKTVSHSDLEVLSLQYKDYMNEIKNKIIEAHLQDIQVAIHAIGDYAVYATTKVLKAINQQYGSRVKHRIEHLQAVRPQDIKLLIEANIHASMQSIHIKEDEELIKKKWLIARDYAFPLKSVSEAVEMALGSDSPVETLNPFEGLKYAVSNHKTEGNQGINKEKMQIFNALDSYTFKHHIIANKPVIYGKIEEGQRANIIVVKKEIFDDLWKFDNYEVEMTMLDGDIVWEK